jgi:hypothetical protein
MRPRKNGEARDADTKKEMEPKMPQLDQSHHYQALSAYSRGAVDMVNALRSPGNILCIAEKRSRMDALQRKPMESVRCMGLCWRSGCMTQ